MKQYPHNIYIHVPFCRSKCKYCAFFSNACAEPDWGTYANSVCDEIVSWGQRLGKSDVPTVFFGGGTPSLVPEKYIEQIIGTIHKNFAVSKDVEITLESNPATLDDKKLKFLKSVGINRLSVGAQRLDDLELKFLGRIHSVDDTIKLIMSAQDIGLRVSADFIYGLPNDTVSSVVNICKQINSLNLTHCSLYELTIEPNTPFGKMNLGMPTNDEMACMYQAIAENLNLPRYEVSNYACSGNECRHNQNVWDGEPYIGIGQGAAGRVLIDNTWYEQLGNDEFFKELSSDERAIEKILTGLRTVRGCRLTQDVKSVIDIDWVNNHPEYIQNFNDRICVTDKGLLILDNLITNVVR